MGKEEDLGPKKKERKKERGEKYGKKEQHTRRASMDVLT
jgi:hypothetical protein